MIFRNTAYDFPLNTGVPSLTWNVYTRLYYTGVHADDYTDITSSVTITEDTLLSNGGYMIHIPANLMDGNIIEFLLVEDNPVDPLNPLKFEAVIETADPVTEAGASYINNIETMLTNIYNKLTITDVTDMWTYTMYTDNIHSIPLVGCTVKMSTDIEGQNVIASQETDSDGKTYWRVNKGATYYMWREMPGYTFDDPDIERIPNELAPLSIDDEGEADKYIEEPKRIKWEYKMYTDPSKRLALTGCEIKVTNDIEGNDTVGDIQITDQIGNTEWMLIPGIYYFWRKKDGYTFLNPIEQKVIQIIGE